MDYKPIDECRTVAELLADPERWTQGLIARNINGKVSFCLLGAIVQIYPASIEPTKDILRPVIGTHFIVGWNDDPDRTHAEVLAAVKKAGI